MFYAVTQGQYSAYEIIAITTDRDVAQKICDKFGGEYSWDECRIEEYPDGEVMLKPGYQVLFDKDGNVNSCSPFNIYDYRKVDAICQYGGWRKFLAVSVLADTQEAAVKIASERRAQYLAEQMGL